MDRHTGNGDRRSGQESDHKRRRHSRSSRHTGDRYSGNGSSRGNYNQESDHKRRRKPSRSSRHGGERYSGNGSSRGNYNQESDHKRRRQPSRSPIHSRDRYSGNGNQQSDHKRRRQPSPSSDAPSINRYPDKSIDTNNYRSPNSHRRAGPGVGRRLVKSPPRHAARGKSPDRGNFAKLFVGSVPRTATEQDVRQSFEKYGNVIDVSFRKHDGTGQQRGYCLVKYATTEEADQAIKALHNKHTLPGGVAPISVRYCGQGVRFETADRHKLYVASLNKKATEQEVGKIFLPYGEIEHVYLMRDEMQQSHGCGFVTYSHKKMAVAAIRALHGTTKMEGCDQTLTVRFANRKRPRPIDSRVPAFGGPSLGPRSRALRPRRAPNRKDPIGDRIPPNPCHPMSPPKSGDLAMPLNQSFNQSFHQTPPLSQQISPLQKPLQSPQKLPPTSQLQAQARSSYSQAQVSHNSQTPFRRALPHQQPLLPPLQQSPSDLGHMVSQQTQTPQTSFQLQMIQQQSQHLLSLPQNSQATKYQYPGNAPQMNPHNHATTPTPAAVAICNWSEETTLEGFVYYWNSVTNESKGEKPEELSLHERQQQPQQLQPTLPLVQQSQTQPNYQALPTQQVPLAQLMQHHPQAQTQFRQQQPAFSHVYPASRPGGQQYAQEFGYTQQAPAASNSVNNPAHFQGGQPTQEWMWNNKQPPGHLIAPALGWMP